jgi:tRNA (cmo5U34)-methyltransferase
MKTGDGIEAGNANWSFGGNVPETFVSHVAQSVPLYAEGHQLICQISDFFCLKDSLCYEIGVSAGELLKKLAEHHTAKPNTRWIGVDTEKPMIEKAREHCAGIPNIELKCDDVRLMDFEKSDFIVSYYCMQFIPPRYRQDLINRIYESLNWGGAFILFEKVRGPDARFQDLLTTIYNDFKLRNGFSTEEIVGKAQSLKGVMEPFSIGGNMGLLRRAGFEDIMTIQKYICFEGFLAIK